MMNQFKMIIMVKRCSRMMNQFKNDKFFIGHVDDEKNSQQVEKNVNEKECE